MLGKSTIVPLNAFMKWLFCASDMANAPNVQLGAEA